MKILNPLHKVFVSWLAATGLAGIILEPVLADTLKPAWAIVPGGTILDDGVDPPATGGVILPVGLTSANTYNAYPWFTTSGGVQSSQWQYSGQRYPAKYPGPEFGRRLFPRAR